MKFPLEIVHVANKAKKEFGTEDFIIGYRFSPEEVEEKGITIDGTLYLVDRLCNEPVDYLHISLGDFKGTSMRNSEDTRVIGALVSARISGRKPLIGVGGIANRQQAEEALSIGYDLVAIGHAAVIEPNWVEKVQNNDPIETAIHMSRLEEQVIPERMANAIASIPGWFQVK